MSSNNIRELNAKEESLLRSAPPFDPYERYTEVHGHGLIKYCQNGVYYSAVGRAVSVKPSKPKITRGIKQLREGVDGNRMHDSLSDSSRRVVGQVTEHRLPPNVVKARIEDAKAKAAEEFAE